MGEQLWRFDQHGGLDLGGRQRDCHGIPNEQHRASEGFSDAAPVWANLGVDSRKLGGLAGASDWTLLRFLERDHLGYSDPSPEPD